MLLLTTTASKLQLVTTAAGAISVYAAWIDNASGTVTPDSANLAPITTAATTDVIGAPAASTQRNVKNLTVTNTAAVANGVAIQHTDGSIVETLWTGSLGAGETVTYNGYDFVLYNSAGQQVLTSTMEQWLTDRIAQKASARQTFTASGMRVDASGSVTVNSGNINNVYGFGYNSQMGQSIQQSQLNFQCGFRRNLSVT